MEFMIQTNSPEETLKVGKKLGSCLHGGDVIALYGGLGAGKTALAQGISQSLQISEPVISPTFTLIHEYKGVQNNIPVKLVHMDLYRLQHPEEGEVIGVEDAFQPDAICLIEWPEICADLLPHDRLDIRIEGNGDLPRIFRISGAEEWDERLKGLKEETV